MRSLTGSLVINHGTRRGQWSGGNAQSRRGPPQAAAVRVRPTINQDLLDGLEGVTDVVIPWHGRSPQTRSTPTPPSAARCTVELLPAHGGHGCGP